MALVQGYRKLGGNDLGIADQWSVQMWTRIRSTVVDLKDVDAFLWEFKDPTGNSQNNIAAQLIDFGVGGGQNFVLDVTQDTGAFLLRWLWLDLFPSEGDPDDFPFSQLVLTWDQSLPGFPIPSSFSDATLSPILYFNGEPQRVASVNTSRSALDRSKFLTNNARSIAVGMNVDATVGSQQDLHSFAIWDTVLPEVAVRKLYNGGSACNFNLQRNDGNYQSESSLQHWWRFGGFGKLLNDAQAENSNTYGADAGGVGSPLINLSDDATFITSFSLVDDTPCGVAPNIIDPTGSPNVNLEELWVTLPFQDVNSGSIPIPGIRGTTPFDFRVWAVGPGGIQSEENAQVSQVPILGEGATETPTGFAATTGIDVTQTGTEHTLTFTWDPPSVEEASSGLGYILRYTLTGDSNQGFTTKTIVYGSGGPIINISGPERGDYFATLQSVDANGNVSLAAELTFTFAPVIPISTLKVRGLKQCNAVDNPEVQGDSFCIEWRQSEDVEDVGFLGPTSVPVLKEFVISVYNFIDNTLPFDPFDVINGTDTNTQFRGNFFQTGKSFTYDISINTIQSKSRTVVLNPGPPASTTTFTGPSRKLLFFVRMLDINNQVSDFQTIVLENKAPPEVIVVGFNPAGPRTLSLSWQRAADDKDPDFQGVIVWSLASSSPLFPELGIAVGEGLVVAVSDSSPVTWDVDPDKSFQIKIAAFDSFPIVPFELNVKLV